MPGTTRYSATFDRPYEEEEDEDLPAVPPLTRRSRSASWQATTANGRPYTPLGGSRRCHARSSSSDNGPLTSASSSPLGSTERIPTRTTGKVPVKTSHNPFQFVKVGTCSLYKKAEEQLKKAQLVPKQDVLKEEEEEWQTNLDSWKTRRRRMSQDVFRRQEEMRLLELEEQSLTQQNKVKVKTFSEMVEERASRGRTMSLCLFSNPLDMDDWNNKNIGKEDSEASCNDMHQSSGSAESSHVNSEDDNDVFQNTQKERNGVKNVNNTQRTRRTGAVHFMGNHNGVNNEAASLTGEENCDFKMSDLTLNGDKCDPCQSGVCHDSGLDSLSSSHRAGDIPDSGSDFSQDSGSSLDCDSPGITGVPTTGTELLEEFSSKDVPPSNGMVSPKEKIDGMELCLKLTLTDCKSQQYGFTINGGKDKGLPVTVASVISGSVSDLVGLKTGDHILAINKEDISSLSQSAVISSLKQSADNKQLELLLWRPIASNLKSDKPAVNGSSTSATVSENISKKAITDQSSSKELSNKTPESKTTRGQNITECSVENKMDTVDTQSNNKKQTVSVRQKDVNSKPPSPAKSSVAETSGNNISDAKKTVVTPKPPAESQHGKNVELENEMLVNDISAASNNSKIPIAEKPPKNMGQKVTKTPQETKKNQTQNKNTDKREESTVKSKESSVEDLEDGGLSTVHQSQPLGPETESKSKELVSLDSELSPSVDQKAVDVSSVTAVEPQTSKNKQLPKFNEKLTIEASEILPVDKVAEQMEKLILEQLEEEERLKEKTSVSKASLPCGTVTTSSGVVQEHELSVIDPPPRQAEPPKEKPPPPPTSTSSTNKESPLNRVNSTKRIKKEIQKRRSDFLGIEKSEEADESSIPPPPDLENILKLECEQERKVRELLGKESAHQRESSFEDEEIARKEREIIENLEAEERMRMTNQTGNDPNVPSSPSDTSFAQLEVERIRKLQEERLRMEEERFLKEEQRIRMEEERQLKDREDQLRREEVSKTVSLSDNSSGAVTVSSVEKVAESKVLPSDKSVSVSESVVNKEMMLKNELGAKNATPTSNVPTSGPNCQLGETNNKPNLVRKTKPGNKKSKAAKKIASTKSEETCAKAEQVQSQSQTVQSPSTQKASEHIPTVDEKKVISTETPKLSEVPKNKPGETTESQKTGSTVDTCVTKERVKAQEVHKSTQQNKQAVPQSENSKLLNKSAPDCKSVVPGVSQVSDNNKSSITRKESMKAKPVSAQKTESLQTSQRSEPSPKVEQTVQQNANTKSKTSASKPKLPASEISADADLSKTGEGGTTQKSLTSEPRQNVILSKEILQPKLDSSSKSAMPSDKPIVPAIPPKAEANKKALSTVSTKANSVCEQKVSSSIEEMQKIPQVDRGSSVQCKTTSSQLSTAGVSLNIQPQGTGQHKQQTSEPSVLKNKEILPSELDSSSKPPRHSEKPAVPAIPLKGEANKKVLNAVSNTKDNSICEQKVLTTIEQEQKGLQVDSGQLKADASVQLGATDVPQNVQPNRTDTQQHDKCIPVQKPNFMEACETTKGIVTVPSADSLDQKTSQPSSPAVQTSQNTEQNKQTDAEKAANTKNVPSGNMIRVRKKKRVPPIKCSVPENATGQGGKSPSLLSPSRKSWDENSSKQRKEEVFGTSDVKAINANQEAQQVPSTPPTPKERVKAQNQEINFNKDIKHPELPTMGQNTECKPEVGSISDAPAVASSPAVPTTNSENNSSVSSVSSSILNDASLSQTGDGKNKETVCLPPASGDQSSVAKESTNNLAPKPVKRKEVIRKERERLRQEQEALQREREEYRRQMMKEQEMMKESQKSHAPDAPASRVGAPPPPPLKPALPIPLISLPHATQALKENAVYTSRGLPVNPANAAVGNHNNALTSKQPNPAHNIAARPKVTQNDAWGPHKVPVVKKQPDVSESRYNQNHWLIQEAEMRRIAEQKERLRGLPPGDPRCTPMPFNQGQYHPMHMGEENYCSGIPSAHQKPPTGAPPMLNKPSTYSISTQMHSPEQQWNYGQPIHPAPQSRKFPVSNVLSPGTDKVQPPGSFARNAPMQPPTKPSRVIPMDRQEQMLSVSGRKRCSHCGEELGRGAAMIIESLQLYYHIQCFRCCVCQAQLGNGSCGTDVRVRNNKLHCHNCYSNDEAGLKFSQV